MDYQPKNIVYGEEEIGKPTNPYSLTHSSTRLTCLFLAAKVENNFITLEDFLKKIKKGPPPAQVLVDLELEVSQGIRFEYVIHHPLWPLHGVFLDIQVITFFIILRVKIDQRQHLHATQDYLKQSISSTSTHKEALKKLAHTYIKAKELVIISLRTDLQFLMWPSQIAIACLQAAAKEYEFMEDFNAYLIKRFEVGGDKVAAMMESKQMQQRQQDSSEPLDNLDGDEVFRRLRAQWDKAETIIKQAQSTTIDKALATSISDKLKTCQNPEFNPDSLISQRRREEALREKEEKRNKKIKMQAEIEAKSHTIFQ